MNKAVFFHAGCSVCVSAEQEVVKAIDQTRYQVELVHLGEHKERLPEARAAGVTSVPALVLDGIPFHINFGASLADLEK